MVAQTKLRLEQIEEIPASEVVNTPAGGIAATDVQGAIDELDAEKEEVEGCHGSSYPINGETINEGNTYTSGDLRDGTVVPSDAEGVWLMLHGVADGVNKALAIDSADDTPDAYSCRLQAAVSGEVFADMLMVRLGTGGNAGKVKIKALTGNWGAIYAWPVGWWR